MTDLARLATRIFGAPLLMERGQLDTILATIGPRFGVRSPVAPQAFSDADEQAQRQPDRQRRPYRITPEGAAVVPVVGALVSRAGQVTPDCTELRSYAAIERDLVAAARDPQVRGTVLDIDSPGGEAANVMELSGRIAAMRGGKPIIAYVNPGAYSAAYAIASAADRIVLPRTGGVGSVGVVALHIDRSGEDEKLGRRYTWMSAGAHKLDGNPHAPLTDAAQAVMMAEVERIYGIFVGQVAQNRAMAGLTEALLRTGEAGLFFGENAIAARLADVIGGFDDAVRLAVSDATRSGRGRPSAQTPTSQGAKMEDDNPAGDAQANTPPTPPAPPAPPVDMAALQAAANQRATANSAEIAALCELAGVPARAAGFIAASKSPADVRAALLAERAEASAAGGEISANRNTPPPGAGATNSAATAASWDKAGRQAFGEKWKGI